MIRFLLSIVLTSTAILPISQALAADEPTSIEDLLGGSAAVALPEDANDANGSVTVGISTQDTSNKKLDIGRTGLPIPRFVSLKRGTVNVRKGPNETFDISWTFTRQNLPVEITAEYDNWRKIRDHLGGEGWIFHSLLSGTRYAMVNPWETDNFFTIHQDRSASSDIIAKLEAGTLGNISACDGTWCQLKVTSKAGGKTITYTGNIKQEFLWGIYPGDTIK